MRSVKFYEVCYSLNTVEKMLLKKKIMHFKQLTCNFAISVSSDVLSVRAQPDLHKENKDDTDRVRVTGEDILLSGAVSAHSIGAASENDGSTHFVQVWVLYEIWVSYKSHYICWNAESACTRFFFPALKFNDYL